MPELNEIAELAHARGLVLYEDAGSGALFDLRPLGLEGEPVINESLRAGVDVVTFSGDKLLGGIQAGCIAGRRELIEKIRKHPLFRALRADKMRLAALEATLESYRRGAAQEEIPALRMMALTETDTRRRAQRFLTRLRRVSENLRGEIVAGFSAIGGGSAPLTQPPSALLALTHANLSASELEAALRAQTPPVIARVAENRVLLDLRTVDQIEEGELLAALVAVK
jgi:L-seryl-tRNA(Ser) seleniumtransferase